MFRYFSALLVVFGFSIFATFEAYACSCAPNYSTLSEYIEEVDVLFEGKVISIELGRTTFEVRRKYKKSDFKTITISHPNYSCWGDFKQGSVHLVPAKRADDGSLFTHLCLQHFDKKDLRIYTKRNGNYTGIPDSCASHIASGLDYLEAFGGDLNIDEKCQKFIPAFIERYR